MLSPSGRQVRKKAGRTNVAASRASFDVTVGQSSSQSDPAQPLKVNWTDAVWEILIDCYLDEATRNSFAASNPPLGRGLRQRFSLPLDLPTPAFNYNQDGMR